MTHIIYNQRINRKNGKGIDYVDLDSISSPSSVMKRTLGSSSLTKKTSVPHKRNLSETSSLLSPSSLARKWGKDATKLVPLPKKPQVKKVRGNEVEDDQDEEEVTRKSKKIRIYPTKNQKKQLLVWMKDARLTYNYCVDMHRNEKKRVGKFKVRDMTVTKNRKDKNKNPIPEDRPRRILETFVRTPKDIRAHAAFDYVTAHNNSVSARASLTEEYKELYDLVKKGPKADEKLAKAKVSLAKLKSGTKDYVDKLQKVEECKKLVAKINEAGRKIKEIPKWKKKDLNVKYRTKKNTYSHIWIEKKAMSKENEFSFYSSYKLGEIKRVEQFEIVSDFMIRRNNRLDSWEVIISEKVEIEDPVVCKKFISFDPGVRTFLTGTDSDGKVVEYNPSWYKIEKKFDIIDRIQSIINHKVVNKQRLTRKEKKLRKKKLMAERKIVSIIDNSHKQIALDIIENYDLIILPKLRTKQLVGKEELSSHVKRRIATVAHCKFHDYISHKAKVYRKTLVDIDESYTTKTCYNCGFKNDIGSNKVYQCQTCGRKTDRDVQASLNILTKFVGTVKRV